MLLQNVAQFGRDVAPGPALDVGALGVLERAAALAEERGEHVVGFADDGEGEGVELGARARFALPERKHQAGDLGQDAEAGKCSGGDLHPKWAVRHQVAVHPKHDAGKRDQAGQRETDGSGPSSAMCSSRHRALLRCGWLWTKGG